jgi:mono/diheme cytochrome c family protein
MKDKGLIITGLSLLLAAILAISLALPAEGNPTRGAMLYDNWYGVLGVQAPSGSHPIWGRQTTNTRSGPDTWRCVSCHGWDYQGKDGAYRAGSGNFTGFPGVYAAVQNLSQDEIIQVLKGVKDPQHDFSKYLDDASLTDLAGFLKTGLIDDSQYIDPQSLSVKGGDAGVGKQNYNAQCADCHGEDGAKLKFRFEGRDATLGTLAVIDPWRFLHKTRFGTPGTPMVVGADLGWTAQVGRDVLLYTQSLPSGLETSTQPPVMSGREGESAKSPGGPVQSIFTGMLTALGAVFTGVGFAVLLGVFLVGILFVIVWSLRGKNK